MLGKVKQPSLFRMFLGIQLTDGHLMSWIFNHLTFMNQLGTPNCYKFIRIRSVHEALVYLVATR